jgi:DNA-binding Lrp family transcriptional regulator
MKEEHLLKVMCELMKNSRQSDRAIAEKLKVSQPTVTRARAELEKKGYVHEYTLVPDFPKIGCEIMAITLMKTKDFLSEEERKKRLERARNWAGQQPNITFAASCEGMGKNGVMISFHKTFSEYIEFTRKYLAEWSSVFEAHDAVLVNMDGDMVVKNFSFACLPKDIENKKRR